MLIRQFANAGYETVFFRDSVHLLPPGTLKPSALPTLMEGFSDRSHWYFNLPVDSTESRASALAVNSSATPVKQLSEPVNVSTNTFTFNDVRDMTTLMDYLANVPHCSLDDLKELEQEEIKTLCGQLGHLWHL